MGRELPLSWERLRQRQSQAVGPGSRHHAVTPSACFSFFSLWRGHLDRLFLLEPHLSLSSRTSVLSSTKLVGWIRTALKDFAELMFRETGSTLMFSDLKD